MKQEGFKSIPAPQKYMTITQIYETYASRGVVAYSCKVVDSVLEGGVVIAVQDENATDSSSIKKYQQQLRRQHPDKSPIYYLRMEQDKERQRTVLFYDNGGGERQITPKLEVRKSAAEEAVLSIPDDLLAQALSSKTKEE